MLTHRNLLSNARLIAAWLRLGPADRFLTVMPLFHANAIVLGLVTPLVAGGGVVIVDRFRAADFWAMVDRHRPTATGTVPTMLALLLARPTPPATLDRSSLRFVLTGSAPVPADLLLAFETRFGMPVIEGYGLTECTCRATFNPIDGRRRPGSCGLPLAPLRIVDAEDRDVVAGAVGEIVRQGPHVMHGYFRDPASTATALRGGWLHSGDLGRIDEDGFVHVVGRASELVIRGGENVYPREIEEVLLAHPDVVEAAVVGAPDPLYGEVVAAFLVPRSGVALEPAGIARWCALRLADFKCPAHVTIVPELAKGPTGKILKGPLRAASLTLRSGSN
jgi:acyl-CoA synthetase (AMP-forming)/AMP-acid ligase II